MKVYRKKPIYVLVIISILFTLLFAGCSEKTSYEGSLRIIEAQELSSLLGKENVVVVDARSVTNYKKGHLVNAVNIPTGTLTTNKPAPAMVIGDKELSKVLGSKGIKNDDLVIVYDDDKGVSASRVFWTLKLYGHEKVMVLNGGTNAILSSGLKISAKSPSISNTTYEAKPLNQDILVSLEDIQKVVNNPTKNVKILDVRTQAEFDEGHIPGSILYSHKDNMYKDDTFKSSRNIYLTYKDLGLNKDDSIYVYCKSSFRATQTYILLKEAGFNDVKVYDGAYLQWSGEGMEIERLEGANVLSEQDAS
ncbi:sulfurtransferase [Anaeromicrobium sediminis]|uniref:thiosulfate sulfurtransferase n=1 Tax=Anaeromicrobium sediminis TaxID=1478221 RepID=A0A267MKC0_9FIRM|nr:sulfurtransferase [Anaeromicrobium sediminis]PAB60034.1 hypothetical protein CCE28_06570 [Anaeromicrobium sediminis]